MNVIIIFLILFISGGIIVVLDWAEWFYPILIGLLTLQIVFNTKKKVTSKKSLIYQLLILALFLIGIFIRKESFFDNDNALIVLKILIVMYISIYVKTVFETKYHFLAKYIQVFEKLMILSLFTFVISNIFPFTVFSIKDEFLSILGLGFTRTFDFSKYGLFRNQGIFWEPGVLGFFTCLTYIFKVWFFNDKRNKNLYYITIISTLSMGTILVFLLIVIYEWLQNNLSKNKMLGYLAILFAPISIIVIAIIPSLLLDFLSTLFRRDITTDNSILTRSYDLYYGILSALQKVYFGHGKDFTAFYDLTLQEINKTKAWYDGGITNSVVSILYCYGVLFLVLYLSQVYGVFSAVKSKKSNFFLFIILMGLLMIEPLHFSVIMLLFITMKFK